MSFDRTAPPTGSAMVPGAKEFDRSFQALSPGIVRYARSLCGDSELARDLVQEAALRAWRSRARFVPGTNFKAWCYRILRNCFLTKVRRDGLVRIDLLGDDVPEVPVHPSQEFALDLQDFERGWAGISDDQRRSLTLVAVDGCSFEEAALIVGVPLGTIKSRVVRGRRALLSLVENPNARSAGVSFEEAPTRPEIPPAGRAPSTSADDKVQAQMLREWRAGRGRARPTSVM